MPRLPRTCPCYTDTMPSVPLVSNEHSYLIDTNGEYVVADSTTVLATCAIRTDFLAVTSVECQDPAADGASSQDRVSFLLAALANIDVSPC